MSAFGEQIIAKAIDYIANLDGAVPDLESMATIFGYEATHFQKLFKDKVGISPKRMIQYVNYKRARDFLLDGYPTLEAAYQAGLSGSGRLHDLFVSCEAASPGIVQRRGAGITIRYGFHPSPIGDVLIGQTERGVCWLGFVANEDRDESLHRMIRHWPQAVLQEDGAATSASAAHVMRIWQGQGDRNHKLRLDLHGTNFQIQVWQALLKIPAGGVTNYQAIASALGDENASRAVGTAVGANPIALLIPCHRVIQKSGIVENYAWGTPRKKIILALESPMMREEA